jgi:hypothetical protein
MAKQHRKAYTESLQMKRDLEDDKDDLDDSEIESRKKSIRQYYLNFFEHLGTLIDERKLNEKIAKSYFSDTLNTAQKKYPEEIKENYPEIQYLIKRWLVLDYPPDERKLLLYFTASFLIGLPIGIVIGLSI